MEELKSICARSSNTASAMENAGKSLDKIADGKNAPEYETYSNMAYIGLSKVEAIMDIGKKFRKSAASYLKKKEDKQIAGLAATWAIYTVQDEYLNSPDGNLAQNEKSDSSKWEDDNAGRIFGFFLKIRTNNSALGQYVNEIATMCEGMRADWKINNGADEMRLNEMAGMQLNSAQTMVKYAFPSMVRVTDILESKNTTDAVKSNTEGYEVR